jgi:3-dehydroquinate synthetase
MLGWLSERDFQQIVLSLKKAGLPTQIKAASIDKILERIEKDKKRIKEQVMWTLLKSIGQAVIDVRVKEEIVRKAIRQITAI